MAEAHGDTGAAGGDVVELQGAVTVDEVKDIGGIHGGAGKLATAVDVEKRWRSPPQYCRSRRWRRRAAQSIPIPTMRNLARSRRYLHLLEDDGRGKKRKLAFTEFDPYDPEYSDDEEYEYDSGEDVYKGNFASFTAKEVEKIKAKGVASFYSRKIKKWRCPYCTTKLKPKDGRFYHLVSHAEDVAIRGEDYMIRGQHAALAKALSPV
ncbi:hypothetical protein D1007_34224 [Hordeum vulgare]|nr:hypothetical protein D1007_34224 [Hordeum vulgare]